MTKKRARFNFILVGILVILGILLCFAKFPMPYSTNKFVGFYSAMEKTQELSKGYVAVYDVQTANASDKDYASSIETLSDILREQGFIGSKVYRQNNAIRVETQSIDSATKLLETIGTPTTIQIKNSTETTSDYELTEKDILKAQMFSTSELTKVSYGISITFTKDGQNKFKSLTQEAIASNSSSANIYIYVNGEKQSQVQIDSEMDTKVISFTLGSTEDSNELTALEANVKEYVLKFNVATADVKIQTRHIAETTALVGEESHLVASIVLGAVFVLTLLVMIVAFKDLGLLSGLATIIYMILTLFFIQAIPGVYVSISGMYGLLFGTLFIQGLFAIIFNKMKKEYVHTKRIDLAFKNGYRKSIFKILDICVVVFLLNIVFAFFKNCVFASFGMIMSIASVVALFTIVVIAKDFFNWYLVFNNKNASRLNFKKETKEND